MSDMKVIVSTNILPVEIKDIPTIMKGDKGNDGRDGSYTQKAYKTYASMVVDKANIPANTNVVVNNDPDKSKNAYYTYNGTEFTKSDFDPQGILTNIDVRLNQAVESASDYFEEKVNEAVEDFIDKGNNLQADALITIRTNALATDNKIKADAVIAANTVFNKIKSDAVSVISEAIDGVSVDANLVTDALVNTGGGVSQRTLNIGLESIDNMLAINNPINGMRVFAKSYYASLNSGGGWFVYDSEKSTVNDNIVTFNGWVRQLESNHVSTAMAGFKPGLSSAVACIRSALDWLRINGGGKLELTDGVYNLDQATLIQDPRAGISEQLYWFEPVSNTTVFGSRNAVLRIDDGVIFADVDSIYSKGYEVFNDINCGRQSNFRLTGFTFDGNAAGNLLPVKNSHGFHAQCPFVAFRQSDNFEMDNLLLKNSGGYQIVRIVLGCKGQKIHNNEFRENGKINGNDNLADHSSIYNEGDNYEFYNNTFENSVYEDIATAIETHGKHGLVYNNRIINYNVGILRAAMLSDSYDVLVYGNIGEGLRQGFYYEAMNEFKLETQDFNNNFKLRTQEVSDREIVGINIGGNSFTNSTGNHVIRNYGNTYELAGSASSTSKQSIAILGGFVPYLESKNTFINFYHHFQSGIVNLHSNVNKIVIEDRVRKMGGTALVHFDNWDGNIAKYSNNIDINILELSDSPTVTTLIFCKYADATLTGTVKGNFKQSIMPYDGAWNNNTIVVDIVSSTFVRTSYQLPESISCVIETPTSKYTKYRGDTLKSERVLAAKPTVVQNGGDFLGDVVINSKPISGSYSRWVCTENSVNVNTLGTWKGIGLIES